MSTIAIAAVGSRGDVVPLTGLGAALRRAGHRVVIAAYTPFSELVSRSDCEFRDMPSDFNPGAEDSDIRTKDVVAAMFGPSGQRDTGQLILDALADVPADLLLIPPLAELAGHPLAEARGIPSVGVRLQPLSPTVDHPPSLLGDWSAGRLGNRAAGAAGAWVVDRLYGGVVAHFRHQLGLPTMSTRMLRRRRTQAEWPILHGYSSVVAPRPADWRPGLHVTGYWWPPDQPDWQPPPELADFLAAGQPPVYLGLGSTVVTRARAQQLCDVIATGLRKAGVRGLVQSGWAGLDISATDILTIGEAPHDWLFPRMVAVAHHCGAGTTAAALRAGRPNIPIPGSAGDQPFWAKRLQISGAATGIIPQRALTADHLAAAITATLDDAAASQKAHALAARIGGEDGAAVAVASIERVLASPRH
ncbi:UDP:flavonoid glycosyltransferase YjiC, YdhE family [Mycolicibacterium neoaurum]|uniref:glycosyltransferase n=1 Tax=Mycolicibacterium neoaurum TaxID=1795 RepID=UPI00056AF42C|nr:glycosyltransferase [Mycolicibacterium neoaurum]SDC10976.1 UDP:flavonoid glycosyltransferase YjiC, YdhE family [Mycolicibacterium neoaurum]